MAKRHIKAGFPAWFNYGSQEFLRSRFIRAPASAVSRIAWMRDSGAQRPASIKGRCQTLFLVLTCCLRNQKQSLTPRTCSHHAHVPSAEPDGGERPREMFRPEK